MAVTSEKRSGGALSWISSVMTSFAGIMTAIATITTSATAVLGVVVHHQGAQLSRAQQKVTMQQQQIRQLRSLSAATAPASTPAASSTGTAALGAVAHYLSSMTPTVDNSTVQTGQQVIAAQPYVNSISFSCDGGYGDQPGEAYNVAGNGTFTAEAGIADDTSGATDVIATLTFTNEAGQRIGKPVQVSLGHPVKLSLNIGGVTQLGITCNGRDQRTSQVANGFQVALGDAGVS